VLSQADLSFEFLSMCLRGDGHSTPKDHIDLAYLILVIGIGSTMFATTWLLCHWCWWWHLLMVQKSFALFQIMSYGTMDLTPLLCVSRVMEHSSF
jgi:hypothetical protein